MRWPFWMLGVALAAAGAAQADPVPRGYVASPEIYRVLAERDQRRVILVVWAPGQRDALHSHPAASGYFLTDCSLHYFFPDGREADRSFKAGAAFVQPDVVVHSLENRGAAECRVVMFEQE